MSSNASDNDRVPLTADEAIAMLPDGEEIHTFRNPAGGILVGCDWSRTKLIEAILSTDFRELAGEQATAMKHGLCIRYHGEPLFIETATTNGEPE